MIRFINANRAATAALAVAIGIVIATTINLDGEPNPATPPTSSIVVPRATSSIDAAPAGGSVGRENVPLGPFESRLDRTEPGARQAAIDYAGAVQQRIVYLSEPAATDLLASWSAATYDDDDIAASVAEVAALRRTLTGGGGRAWWSVTPIASHVAAFDRDRARVSVWVAQVVGSNADPQLGGEAIAPTVDFRITTIDLVWDDAAGWSVWATSAESGPFPMIAPGSIMSAPAEFIDALADFTLTREHS